MSKNTRRNKVDAERFGFRWGQLDVVRLADLPQGGRAIEVSTDYGRIEIYVSKTGRRIRVFGAGKELK